MKNMPAKNHNPANKGGDEWEQFTDFSAAFFSPVQTATAFMQFIGTFIFNILRIACVPAELIFRRNFGERHFNLYLYFGGSLWLGIFATGWLNIPAMLGFKGEGLVPNAVIFTIVAIIFYARMFWRFFVQTSKEIDLTLYSRYDGDPLSLLTKLPFATDKNGHPKEYQIRQFIEPGVMILLGAIFTFILNPQTGTWLFISGFCMAVKEYVKARHIRNLILDAIDAEIVSKNTAEAIRGKPAKETQGVYFAGVSNNGKDREILQDVIARRGNPSQANSTN